MAGCRSVGRNDDQEVIRCSGVSQPRPFSPPPALLRLADPDRWNPPLRLRSRSFIGQRPASVPPPQPKPARHEHAAPGDRPHEHHRRSLQPGCPDRGIIDRNGRRPEIIRQNWSPSRARFPLSRIRQSGSCDGGCCDGAPENSSTPASLRPQSFAPTRCFPPWWRNPFRPH